MDPRIQKRYAPMSRDHITVFPHKMPEINWMKNLPIFRDEKVDDPLLHLIKFHIHIRRLKVEWHEDCLVKLFMATLEGSARNWYEWLEPGILFSLRSEERRVGKECLHQCRVLYQWSLLIY